MDFVITIAKKKKRWNIDDNSDMTKTKLKFENERNKIQAIKFEPWCICFQKTWNVNGANPSAFTASKHSSNIVN